MAIASLPPIPYSAPLLEGGDTSIAHDWYLWLATLVALLQVVARVVTVKSFVNQGAAIPATALNVTAAGVYRVGWTLRITQPATVSSSVTVTISYADQAVVISVPGAAVTGNLTTTVQSGILELRSDAVSPVTIAVAYVSVGATPCLFKVDVTAEQIG